MQGSRPPELRELLMGHGQGQLHLSAVSSVDRWLIACFWCTRGAPGPAPRTHLVCLQVRARAEELKRSLDQIIQSLQYAADRVQW